MTGYTVKAPSAPEPSPFLKSACFWEEMLHYRGLLFWDSREEPPPGNDTDWILPRSWAIAVGNVAPSCDVTVYFGDESTVRI